MHTRAPSASCAFTYCPLLPPVAQANYGRPPGRSPCSPLAGLSGGQEGHMAGQAGLSGGQEGRMAGQAGLSGGREGRMAGQAGLSGRRVTHCSAVQPGLPEGTTSRYHKRQHTCSRMA
eukprot:365952-Chlamydomonas_euryale.AAC.6